MQTNTTETNTPPTPAVSRIPPEILTEILLLYRRSGADTRKHPLCPYSWLVVTHVCKLWREVALKNPALWRRIIYTNRTPAECIQEIRVRSQNLSLHLIIWASEKPRWIPSRRVLVSVPQHLADLLSDIPRAHTLELVAPPELYEEHRDSIPLQMPLLESLTIRFMRGVPEFIGTADMPNLKELTLEGSNLNLSFSHPVFSHALTKLVLKGFNEIGKGVLDLLRRIPELEYLALHGWYDLVDRVSGAWPKVQAQITLPRLEYLSLKGDMIQVTYLLYHMEYPRTIPVRLHFTLYRDPVQVQRVSPIIVSALPMDNPTIRGMAVWRDRKNTIFVDFYRDCPPLHLDTASFLPHSLHHRVQFGGSRERAIVIVNRVLLQISLANVETAIFHNFNIQSAQTSENEFYLQALLKAIPNATTIRTSGDPGPASHITKLLSKRSDFLSSPNAQWLVPSLQILLVEGMTFRRFPDERKEDRRDALIHALNARAAEGMSLQRLILNECTDLCLEDVEIIRSQLAGTIVEWDGLSVSMTFI